jgi:peptidoglycan/xylan/chitin deacetylase (PgdA/CDA1 family)
MEKRMMGARRRRDRLGAPALRRLAAKRSVILGYHGIASASPRDDLFRLLIPPDQFVAQLELLLGSGFHFTTLTDLVDKLDGGDSPPGYAVVTFDDGLRDNYTTALPILRHYEIPATVYVCVGFIGGSSPWIGRGPAAEMLSEDEVRALAAAGWEIGAHTMTHPDLSQLDYDGCLSEIESSRDALARIAGAPIETFAYPFGRYGTAAVAAVRDAGFRAAVTIGSGSWDPFTLTRAMISARDPLPVTLLKIADRYEPLVGSAALRFARKASRRIRSGIGSRSYANDARPSSPPAE